MANRSARTDPERPAPTMHTSYSFLICICFDVCDVFFLDGCDCDGLSWLRIF